MTRLQTAVVYAIMMGFCGLIVALSISRQSPAVTQSFVPPTARVYLLTSERSKLHVSGHAIFTDSKWPGDRTCLRVVQYVFNPVTGEWATEINGVMCGVNVTGVAE